MIYIDIDKATVEVTKDELGWIYYPTYKIKLVADHEGIEINMTSPLYNGSCYKGDYMFWKRTYERIKALPPWNDVIYVSHFPI